MLMLGSFAQRMLPWLLMSELRLSSTRRIDSSLLERWLMFGSIRLNNLLKRGSKLRNSKKT